MVLWRVKPLLPSLLYCGCWKLIISLLPIIYLSKWEFWGVSCNGNSLIAIWLPGPRGGLDGTMVQEREGKRIRKRKIGHLVRTKNDNLSQKHIEGSSASSLAFHVLILLHFPGFLPPKYYALLSSGSILADSQTLNVKLQWTARLFSQVFFM